MKSIVLFLFVIFCSINSIHAQQTLHRYCHIIIPADGGPENDMSNKHKIKILLDYGSTKTEPAFRDSVTISSLEKVKDLKTSVTVLNYMAQIGWNLIHLNSPTEHFTSYEMYYEKEFPAQILNLEAERIYK